LATAGPIFGRDRGRHREHAGAEHRDDPGIGLYAAEARLPDRLRQLASVRFRHVDVEHRGRGRRERRQGSQERQV